jgi:hypothetical protein
MKAVQITDSAWFLQNADQTIALITKHEDHFTLLTPDINERYEKWKDIESDFGKISVSKKRKSVREDGPGGYPIRHPEFFNVTEGDKYHTYTVTEKSHVRYVSGYWCLKFANSNKYQVVLCPKEATVKEHDALGPYKHRIECLNEANILNSRTEQKEDVK